MTTTHIRSTRTDDDVLTAFARTVDTFAARLREVGADRWHDPTPCADWDVRQLANHVAAELAWTVPLLRGATIAEIGDSLSGDLLGEEPVAAFDTVAAQAQQAAGRDGALRRTVTLSAGDTAGADYLSEVTADVVVHTWDLARAIDLDEQLPGDLVQLAQDVFTPQVAAWREAGMVGPPVEVPADADAQTRLMALLGRRTDWTADPAIVAVHRFNAAFNRRDVDAVMATLTDDIVLDLTPAPDGEVITGHEGVRQFLHTLFAATRERTFDAEEVFGAGDRVVVLWRQRWVDHDGSRGHVRGIDVMRVRDGRVAEKLVYVKG